MELAQAGQAASGVGHDGCLYGVTGDAAVMQHGFLLSGSFVSVAVRSSADD
jgi:hypothetical protein